MPNEAELPNKRQISPGIKFSFQDEKYVVESIDLWGLKPYELTEHIHGTIKAILIEKGKNSYLEVGEVEHFSYFDWQSNFRLLGE